MARTPAAKKKGKAVPKKRKTPWLRRIISTVILLALVGGAGFLVVKGVVWALDLLSSHEVIQNQTTSPQSTSIEPCDPEALKITLTPSATTLGVGESLTVGVSIDAGTNADCSLETSQLAVELAAEETKIWTPTACWSGWDRQLLLSPGTAWERSLVWDGFTHVGCEPAVADDGETKVSPGQGTFDLLVKAPDGTELVTQPIVIQ